MKNQIEALTYCRVSSGQQVTEGTGLGSQESRCKEYSDRNGYKTVKVFRDAGVSGGLFDRPAMKELIAFLDANPTKRYVIVFDDLKRFARDVGVHLRLRSELKSRGATLESPNFRFEDSPEGNYIENISAANAQYEREANRRQVIQKMYSRLTRGFWTFSSAPLGLIYQKDPAGGKVLVKDEPFATILKTAIEKFATNELMTQDDVRIYISDEFRVRGINRYFSINSVKDILTELLYTGYLEFPKWHVARIKAAHEGFISLETYLTVQDKLLNRMKAIPRKDYSVDFPLRSFVICDLCGRSLTASWCKGRNKLYPKYWCKNQNCVSHGTIAKKTLEERFIHLLDGVKLDSPLIKLTQAILLEAWNDEKSLDLSLIMQSEKEKLARDIQIANLSKRISVTEDENLISHYEDQLKGLLDLNQAHKDKCLIKKESYTEEEFRTASEMVFKTLENPVRMWKKPKYIDRSTLIRMHFAEPLRYDVKEGFRTPTLELSLIHI